MLKRLIHTEQDYALTFARLVLGVIFFAHGGQLESVVLSVAPVAVTGLPRLVQLLELKSELHNN
jgi:uncharacterized membrane protein YphA (DoxX/SURF4 family)